jgi:hypothetical protein
MPVRGNREDTARIQIYSESFIVREIRCVRLIPKPQDSFTTAENSGYQVKRRFFLKCNDGRLGYWPNFDEHQP